MDKVKKYDQIREVISILLLLAFIIAFINWVVPTLGTAEVQNFVKKVGPLGPLIIMTYTVVGHIFAPMTGTPIVILSLALYGLFPSLVITYLAHLVSAAINFQISRQLGRKWVKKLAGQRSLKQIDDFSKVEGTDILILSRLLGFPVFEYISYAMGFTSISFTKYMRITALAHLVPSIIFMLIFSQIDFDSKTGIYVWLGSLTLIGFIFLFLLKKYMGKQKNN